MKFIFAAVLTVLAGTAMSASILHKEIEIGHNGVHYKVVVDAEKLHHDTTHNLSDLEKDTSEIEHQDELGKIGIHYEVPDIDHSHHHADEEDHHGVVIHIDLSGGHDEEEHHHEHHDEEHHSPNHLDEHLVLPDHHHYNINNDVKHQVHLELGHDLNEELNPYHLEHHQILDYENLDHILKEDSEENELEHQNIYVPKHYVIGHLGRYTHPTQVVGKHHEQNYIPVHQQGNLWHLLSSKIVKPVKIHGVVPHYKHVELENGSGSQQDIVNGLSFVELEGLHHHTDIHH